jgi:hypothetical protein
MWLKKKKKTSRKEITCSGKWHTLKNTGKDDVLFTLNGNKTKHRPWFFFIKVIQERTTCCSLLMEIKPSTDLGFFIKVRHSGFTHQYLTSFIFCFFNIFLPLFINSFYLNINFLILLLSCTVFQRLSLICINFFLFIFYKK